MSKRGRMYRPISIMRCFENLETQPQGETRRGDIKLRSLRGATQVPD